MRNVLIEVTPDSFIPELCQLISEYAHLGLSTPCNTEYYQDTNSDLETVKIDKVDPLLVTRFPSNFAHKEHPQRWDVIRAEDGVAFRRDAQSRKLYGDIVYFEVTLIQHARVDDLGDPPVVSLGWTPVSSDYPMNSNYYRDVQGGAVGWSKGCIGFHSDDGNILFESGRFVNISRCKSIQSYTTGDTVGAGIDFHKNVVFFTLNDRVRLRKRLASFISSQKKGFIPTVAWRSRGPTNQDLKESKTLDDYNFIVRFNFGEMPERNPFMFEVSSLYLKKVIG